VLVISFLAFSLVRIAPGGPFDTERKPASPEIERNLAARYHLDQPLWKQYLFFLQGVSHGDLGASLHYRNHTVTDIIKQGMPISILLGVLSFGLALGLGVPLGFIAAIRKGTWLDYSATLLALRHLRAGLQPGASAHPALSIHWEIFPVATMGHSLHAVLHVVSLGVTLQAELPAITQRRVNTALQSDFIITARARGSLISASISNTPSDLGILPLLSYSGPLLRIPDRLIHSSKISFRYRGGIGVFMVNSSLNRDYLYDGLYGLALVYSVLLPRLTCWSIPL
jgi:oligopeptide transport system permease protein